MPWDAPGPCLISAIYVRDQLITIWPKVSKVQGSYLRGITTREGGLWACDSAEVGAPWSLSEHW